jgi:thiol-disulfide isomerase/thioredoxin
MKNILKILALMLLTTLSYGQEGIRFQKGEWKEVLRQARLFKKIIFIDTYTTWCGPCKQMDKEVFSQAAAGNKFNETFINYKVDAEKGEGIILAKKFGVSSYPTLLFVDAEENIVHKREGSMPLNDFVGEAELVVASMKDGKPVASLEREYVDGRRDPEFYYSFINKRTRLKVDNKAYLDEYLYTLPPKEQQSEKILRLLMNNEFEADSRAFDILCANKDKIESFMAAGEQRVLKVLGSAVYASFDKLLKTKDTVALEKLLTKNMVCSPNIAERMNSKYRMLFYQNMKDIPKFLQYADEYLNTYLMYQEIEGVRKQDDWQYEVYMFPYRTGAKDSTKRRDEYEYMKRMSRTENARQMAAEFESVVKSIIDNVSDKDVLEKSIVWMNRSLELIEMPDNLSTFAALMQKLGDKNRALSLQAKAIELASQYGADVNRLKQEYEKMRL